jgi:hypothetical protein
MALLGITVTDEEFYTLAVEGAEVTIDVKDRKVKCGEKEFPFGLSQMEENLIAAGGVTEMYQKYGASLFRAAVSDSGCASEATAGGTECGTAELAW